jgi:tetratricopeptide (TPR) repeat protein
MLQGSTALETRARLPVAASFPQSVFLSSTGLDLQPYRDAIAKRLAGSRFFRCVRHEQNGPADMTAVDFCREAIHSSNIYVGLIGLRRGFEPHGGSSITEMEFDWAGEASIARMVWLTPDDFSMDGRQAESAAVRQRQQDFRERIMRSIIVARTGFESPSQLALEVENHLLAHFAAGDLAGQGPGGNQALLRRQLAEALEQAAISGEIDLDRILTNPAALNRAGLLQQLDRRTCALELRARDNPKTAAALKPQIASSLRDMAALASLEAPEAALPLYEKALRFDPGHVATQIAYGDRLRRLGRIEEANAAYRAAERQARKTGQTLLQAHASHSRALLEDAQGNLR